MQFTNDSLIYSQYLFVPMNIFTRIYKKDLRNLLSQQPKH